MRYSCLYCCKLIDHRPVSLFLSYFFCSIALCGYFVPLPCYFDYGSFIEHSEIWVHDSSRFVLFFFFNQDCFSDLGSDVAHMNFKIIYSISVKMSKGIFDMIELNFDCFGKYGHFKDINSAYPSTWSIFPFLYTIFNFLHQCIIILRV